MSFEESYTHVQKLVEKFKQGEKHYISPAYQESEVRQDFLDDFFTALGWDVGHKIQHDPHKQEVKIEKGVKVSGAQKRADYSFSVAPNFRDPKFFAEAKKPANALMNAQDYFQSIRYGWHKGHPFSILTNFIEFHILDCRYPPDINHSIDKCYKRFHYTDYLNKEKFAEIYFLFSREAVADNSIEKIAETLPKRKGKSTTKALFPLDVHQAIDEAFLEEIDSIRETLAKAFKKKDDDLTSEQLTEATQRTVDRLVFIRFLEDKLIEPEHYVSEFGEKGSAWTDFIATCKKLDAKYNGIVFKKHFIDEQNFAGPELSEFRTICRDICHLNSRFLFNEIPIHILGSIYERFLGKVVHATAKRVTVEEKPEIKKAGGVFYTPKYIVDYIVRHTVGKLIEGKTPEQIAKLRFADIACGSGSFVIGVFDYLLDYHNQYYYKHPYQAKKDKCIKKDGLWVLSIQQKQKILLHNIYGVDIDQQATEVTQLSLALKMLEDETTASANEMQVFFHEKILPDMSKNIICGNSLIGTDILNFNGFFSGEEERKLNPMDFEDIFKEIMNNGGFDAIVGNPPYISTKRGFAEETGVNEYFKSKYKTAVGQFDAYTLFIERAIYLLKNSGYWSYIIPKPILTNENMQTARELLIQCGNIANIADFGTPFKDAHVEAVVIILNKSSKEISTSIAIFDKEHLKRKIISNQKFFSSSPFKSFLLNISREKNFILKKIEKESVPLKSIYSKLIRGTECGKKDVTIKHQFKKGLKRLLRGEDVSKYSISFAEYFIDADENNIAKFKTKELYEVKKKIIIRRVGIDLQATIDAEGYWNLNTIYNLHLKNSNYSFLLGLLNSKLISFWFKNKFVFEDKLFPYVRISQLNQIPVKAINFQNKAQKATHDKIVSLVEQMLEAKKELKTAITDKDINYYKRKCSGIDSAIDAVVYTLYGLEGPEIKIIEGDEKS